MKKIKIYTDGSSLGNPGKGGWGVVMVITNYELKIKNEMPNSKQQKPNTKFIELGGFEKNTTNNRMELRAVIEALKYLSARQGLAGVEIHADSAYVLGGVTTWIHNWEKNGWRTANKKPVLNKDLWQELITLVRNFKTCPSDRRDKITWHKVEGHSGHVWNDKADFIATTCAETQKPQKK
jgi:ribonuclease HI